MQFDLQRALEVIDKGGMLLVPNNRLRKSLLAMIAANSKQVVITAPRVEAVDVWVRMTWQRLAQRGIEPFCSAYVLDAQQEQMAWTRIIEESLNTFPLLNPQETAKALSHAYQLMKQWQIDSPDLSRLEQFSGIADIAAFLYWRSKFQILCTEQHCRNLVDAVAELTQYLTSHPIDEHIQLINFYQPPPLYQQLFATFTHAEFVTTVSDEVLQTATLDITRFEFANLESEIRTCAKWAAEKIAQSPKDVIAIVCAAKDSYEELFHAALADVLDSKSLIELRSNKRFIKESRQMPIAQSALIKDALLLLGMHNDEQQADDLCRLLRSPFVLGASGATDTESSNDEREARLHMEQFMRRHFSKRVSWQHFSDVLNQTERNYSCPILANVLLEMRTILRNTPQQQNSAQWSKTFCKLLAVAGWPGEELSERNLTTLKQWQNALEQFADASALLGKMTCAQAIDKLRSFCQQKGSQSSTQQGVEFYSPTEAAGLSFDHLWLLGFTDQNWPASASPSPFLPYEIQKQFDLPGSHSEAQYQAARSALTVLINSTRHTLTVSHASSDGDQEFRPSSLTAPLAEATRPDAESLPLNLYFSSAITLPELQHVCDAPLAEITSENSVSGGHGIISDQAACPFRAFANYRLQIRQLEEFENGLNARDRGSAIHEALEFLYKQIPGFEQLQAMSDEQLESVCHAAAEVAVDFLYRKHRDVMTVRYRGIELQRLTTLLRRFLEQELERAPFTVTANEANIKWQHRSLQLNLRIDRIDQLTDNSLAIIDYKTGKKTASPASWLLERSEDMQLPVYAVASSDSFTEAVSSLCLAHVNVASIEYSGLAEHNNFHRSLVPVEQIKQNDKSWAELNDFFASNVRRLADEFIQGHVAVDPVNGPSTCTFCGLEPLCRIQEKRQASGLSELIEEDTVDE
jgi:probable DNA repair protein